MASIYFRPNQTGGVWWVKYYHPVTSECLRHSFGTADPAQAELLRRRLDLEIELARLSAVSRLLRTGLPVSGL